MRSESMRRSPLPAGGLILSILLAACGSIATETPTATPPVILATEAFSPTNTATSEAVSDCSNGYIALTFDDGPFAGQTEQLLAALEAAHLRATFFDLGQHIAGNEAIVKAQYGNGWVGNHSWSHKDLTTLTPEEVSSELADTQKALQAILSELPIFFRPPYLKTRGPLKDIEKNLNLSEVMATLDSKDWSGISTDEIVKNVSTAWPGAVVLMHDNLSTTRAAIPRIAAFMQEEKLCAGRIDASTGQAVAP